MRDISKKINDSAPAPSGYLDAQEVNSITDELKNVVETAPGGLTLDPSTGPDSSTEMLSQAIVRQAAGGAIYCSATGNSNTHTLAMADPKVAEPSILFEGLTCRYKPPENNTGAVMINAFGLGPKPLVNHLSAIPAADAIDGRVIDIFYDPTIGSGSWVLPAWANALYVGQTPTSPPPINSGEGWEVDGANKGKLNFPGLTADNIPETNDLFAFHDSQDSQHKSISYGALAGLLGVGGGLVGMRLITANGNYTKTTGTTKCLAFAVGGGGGGGGGLYTNNGGGAGGAAIGLIDVSNVSVVSCNIGTGGTSGTGGSGGNGGSTFFGGHLVATGGTGGSDGFQGLAGKGGNASVGLVRLGGQGGGPATQHAGGTGGASFFGGGGESGNYDRGRPNGGAGNAYGAGGGGSDGATAISAIGGAGKPGCILILEFA